MVARGRGRGPGHGAGRASCPARRCDNPRPSGARPFGQGGECAVSCGVSPPCKRCALRAGVIVWGFHPQTPKWVGSCASQALYLAFPRFRRVNRPCFHGCGGPPGLSGKQGLVRGGCQGSEGLVRRPWSGGWWRAGRPFRAGCHARGRKCAATPRPARAAGRVRWGTRRAPSGGAARRPEGSRRRRDARLAGACGGSMARPHHAPAGDCVATGKICKAAVRSGSAGVVGAAAHRLDKFFGLRDVPLIGA
jgi:hypothetical protein